MRSYWYLTPSARRCKTPFENLLETPQLVREKNPAPWGLATSRKVVRACEQCSFNVIVGEANAREKVIQPFGNRRNILLCPLPDDLFKPVAKHRLGLHSCLPYGCPVGTWDRNPRVISNLQANEVDQRSQYLWISHNQVQSNERNPRPSGRCWKEGRLWRMSDTAM